MPGSTPIYGFPYPQSTDLVANYPALGQELAQDIEAVLPTLGGMSPAVPTTIANTGGTATLSSSTVTFTTVSSVSLNGCFTSGAKNYRVIVQFLADADRTGTGIRLRVGGTDATGSNYFAYGVYGGTIPVGGINPGASTSWVTAFAGTAVRGMAVYDLSSPQNAAVTSGVALLGQPISTQVTGAVVYVNHNLATSYDGLTLFTTAGSLTGTISVYSYKN